MAAVFALVFLPVLASIALMLGAFHGSLTYGTALALACFSAMATGVFYGLFSMCRRWEATDNH
ncbi:MAG TPA: hypothetical protein VFQ53_34510 [Kofleriaceae bacterium]|nr:hypothetical protein [Kofleriaceae bacterium]